jgi:hypothetical protein
MPDVNAVQLALGRDVGTAGAQYTVARERPDELDVPETRGLRSPWMDMAVEAVLGFRIDGATHIYSPLVRGAEALEELSASIAQVQDTIMELTTESWPRCPRHYHSLDPRPRADWVAWYCPSSGEATAQLGGLAEMPESSA